MHKTIFKCRYNLRKVSWKVTAHTLKYDCALRDHRHIIKIVQSLCALCDSTLLEIPAFFKEKNICYEKFLRLSHVAVYLICLLKRGAIKNVLDEIWIMMNIPFQCLPFVDTIVINISNIICSRAAWISSKKEKQDMNMLKGSTHLLHKMLECKKSTS